MHYLSERLATDLMHQARSEKRGRRFKPTVTVGPAWAKVGGSLEQDPVEANRHLLADEAELAAKDQVGSVTEPGRFLQLPSAPVEIFAFRFKHWKKHIAVVRIDLGDALVVLTGSASNLAGLNEPRDGWIPSDPAGARRLFEAWSKDNRPTELDAAALEMPFLDDDPLTSAAYLIYSVTVPPLIAATADVLARVDYVLKEQIIHAPTRNHQRCFEHVILGAPILVREPAARAIGR